MVLPLVSSVAAAAPSAAAPQALAAPDRVAAFDAAMARGADGAMPAASSMPPVGATAEAGRAEALERAREGLGLQPAGAAGAAGGGDAILQGMQKLRGLFDGGQNRIGEIMKTSGTDASSLLQMQLELTNFTLLVDMSSKLTGKTTQVFDTLMKGQ